MLWSLKSIKSRILPLMPLVCIVAQLQVCIPTEANAGFTEQFRKLQAICTRIVSFKKELTLAQKQRRFMLLRLFLNFKDPLARIPNVLPGGERTHADSVFITVKTKAHFRRADPAPIKEIQKLILWIEKQGEDFAWEVHDRYLLLLHDSFQELTARKFNPLEIEKIMAAKMNVKFNFYFDQDPNTTEPAFEIYHRALFQDLDVHTLRAEGLDEIFTDIVLHLKNLETETVLGKNKFVVDRDESQTKNVIGFDIAGFLKRTSLAGDWYDIGAAVAKLQRSYLEKRGPLKQGRMYAVTPKFPEADDFQFAESAIDVMFNFEKEFTSFQRDLDLYKDSLEYLHGDIIENRTDLPEATAILVTDIFGALSYTRDLRSTILAEARLLKPSGILVSHRGHSVVLTSSGKILDWFEYVDKYGTGLKLKKAVSGKNKPGKMGIIMERTEAELSLPALQLIYSSGWGTPPKYVFYCETCGQ